MHFATIAHRGTCRPAAACRRLRTKAIVIPCIDGPHPKVGKGSAIRRHDRSRRCLRVPRPWASRKPRTSATAPTAVQAPAGSPPQRVKLPRSCTRPSQTWRGRLGQGPRERADPVGADPVFGIALSKGPQPHAPCVRRWKVALMSVFWIDDLAQGRSATRGTNASSIGRQRPASRAMTNSAAACGSSNDACDDWFGY